MHLMTTGIEEGIPETGNFHNAKTSRAAHNTGARQVDLFPTTSRLKEGGRTHNKFVIGPSEPASILIRAPNL
jgi:hypothetical protein